MTIKKIYHLFFYKIYSYNKNRNKNDILGINRFQAGALLTVLPILCLFIVINEITVFTGYVFTVTNPGIWFSLIAIALACFNYYVFLDKKQLQEYSSEFSGYSKIKNRKINVMMVIICVGIPLLLVISFYQLSLVSEVLQSRM